MKKLFIIALAAVVAMTACTKVNPEEKKSDKISFTVANYMPQTKANSRLDEELLSPEFKCYAWQFTAADAVANTTPFMDSEVVKKKQITDGYEWAPEADYFWPKAGWINFYSYAGESVTTTNDGTSATAIAPTITASNDKKTITFAYANKTINATDNILVADPALHFGIYGENDYDMVTINDKMGDFDYAANNYAYTAITESYTGVPTLFRHRLAKVAFIVKLKTADANKSASTTWEVNVLNDTQNSNLSTLKPVNKGSLTLKNTTAATKAVIGTWDVYNGDTKLVDPVVEQGGQYAAPDSSIGWVASTTATDKETISFATKTLTIEPNATKSAQTDTILLPVRTVMPQVTSGVDFDFAYQVNAKHGNATDGYTTFMTEIVKVSGKKLSEVCPQVTEWKMNQVTVYTITIDPVSKRITFDPAVVEWESATGAIALPLAENN